MPNELKLQAYEKMKQANLPQGDYTDVNNVTQGDIGFSNILKNLQHLDTYNEKHLKEFVQFTRDVDSLRKTDIKKVIPQLSELFEEVYEARA